MTERNQRRELTDRELETVNGGAVGEYVYFRPSIPEVVAKVTIAIVQATDK